MTAIQEASATYTRISDALGGLPIPKSARIAELERRLTAAQDDRQALTAALREVELAYLAELSRARRLARTP